MTTATPPPVEQPVVAPLLPEPKRLWLEALRSGRFRQLREHLAGVDRVSGGVAHCCLGVLCEVAIEAGVDVQRERRTHSEWFSYDKNTVMPPEAVVEWAYGTDNGPVGSWRVPHPEPGNPEQPGVLYLSDLNDDMRMSFEEIAHIIEKDL